MTYIPGVLEQTINAILAQIEKHRVAGGRLAHIKNVIQGSRYFETSGNEVVPLIVITPINFSTYPKTNSSAFGENVAKMSIELRIVQPKITMNNKVSKATNVLYDGIGNGIVNTFQSVCYCLMYNPGVASTATFLPDWQLKLNKMPTINARFEYTENFVEIVCDIDVEYIYVYSTIAHSNS